MTRIVVVGDALLDRDLTGHVERVCPDAPVPVVDVQAVHVRPGGAGLAALLLAADGCEVTLVTALGRDDAGRELAHALAERGIEVVDLGLDGATPEKVRVRASGQSIVRLDHGGEAAAVGALDDRGRRAIDSADAVLVADYGRGVTARPDVRDALLARPAHAPLVWDPHPRGAPPVPGTTVVTPNDGEAVTFCADLSTASGVPAATMRAARLLDHWGVDAVAVTLGARGALVARRGTACLAVPPPVVAMGDSCGAGDRFAGTLTRALADGAIVPEAVELAVAAATAFVAAGGASGLVWLDASAPAPSPREPPGVVARVRAAGGSVVATGGCFDLLHAGHVAMLQAARALGDCLVVLVNSDSSVRRLKGPDRPLQTAHDRCALLAALGCVDDVVVFGEDTPVAALERLRPDIWVKGGDYEVAELPESAALARWGGCAVTVPYLSGRSTTRLFQEVAHRVLT